MSVIGRFLSRSSIDYAAIFDGHGGDQVAEMCAAKMHRFLARHVTMHDDTAVALREAFEEMNSQCKSLPEMGATVVLALILEHRLWVANAGDARAVLGHKTEGGVRVRSPSRISAQSLLLRSCHLITSLMFQRRGSESRPLVDMSSISLGASSGFQLKSSHKALVALV